MSIEVRRITKTFGAFRALNDVSLAIQPGELVALLSRYAVLGGLLG